MPKITIHNVEELEFLKTKIKKNLDRCVEQLREIVSCDASYEVIKVLKLQKCVTEPLTGAPENLLEVINQSMTYVVSIMGITYLYSRYPDKVFHLNMGNSNGPDIYSEGGEIVCECFAAVNAKNNGKLRKDRERLHQKHAEHKYLFYYDGNSQKEERCADINVVRFGELSL